MVALAFKSNFHGSANDAVKRAKMQAPKKVVASENLILPPRLRETNGDETKIVDK